MVPGVLRAGRRSDLAACRTTATLVDGAWTITGQKVWTSLAHLADWCFVLARTEPGSSRHHGLSYLLVPMKQDGVEVRPIRQLTGTSEFNEVFFDGARTDAHLVVGTVGDGWRVAMGTLGFERGVATLGQQVGFRRELDALADLARDNGSVDDPAIRERLARAYVELEVMRAHAVRTLDSGGATGTTASVAKLLWAHWHRALGELAMDVRGAAGADLRRRSRRLATAVPVLARRHDLRRVRRGAAQHHRRAHARPAARGARMTVPSYVPGHQLLADKVVVVTAAAGAGIGQATARRCLEEGAQVVVSDTHERRLAETVERLASYGDVVGTPCDVTSESDVQSLIASRCAATAGWTSW